MEVLGIDPGPTHSAYLVLSHGKIQIFGKVENQKLLDSLRWGDFGSAQIVIEKIASYGMAVGETVFETCFWTGRFIEASMAKVALLPRKQIVLHICNSPRAADSNVRQALIDRYGPPGRKAAPGPTYGVTDDVWSALAIATTFYDQLTNQRGEK